MAATTSTLGTPRVFDPIPTSTLAKQGAQADLVQDPLAGEGFGEHADHETEHGRAVVDQFHPLQLLLGDLGGSVGFIPRELASHLLLGAPWLAAPWARRLGVGETGDRVDPRQDIPWL